MHERTGKCFHFCLAWSIASGDKFFMQYSHCFLVEIGLFEFNETSSTGYWSFISRHFFARRASIYVTCFSHITFSCFCPSSVSDIKMHFSEYSNDWWQRERIQYFFERSTFSVDSFWRSQTKQGRRLSYAYASKPILWIPRRIFFLLFEDRGEGKETPSLSIGKR